MSKCHASADWTTFDFVQKITFKDDIRNAIEQISKRRQNNLIDKITVKTKPSIKNKLSARMQKYFVVNKHIWLVKFYSIAQAFDQNEFSSSERDQAFLSTSNINSNICCKSTLF